MKTLRYLTVIEHVTHRDAFRCAEHQTKITPIPKSNAASSRPT